MPMNFLSTGSGKSAVLALLAFSPIERTHSAWRYLWPFQSRQERVLMLRIFAVGLLLMSLVIWLSLGHGPLPYTLAGGLLGGLWLGPYRSLPAKMTITSRSEARHHLDDVQKLVLRIGFVPGKVIQPGLYHYGVKVPDHLFLRLLYVPGQALDLRVSGHTIELNGQVRWIEWLRGQLLKQMDA